MLSNYFIPGVTAMELTAKNMRELNERKELNTKFRVGENTLTK